MSSEFKLQKERGPIAWMAGHSIAANLIMLVCLLSLGGIPPTAGFIGKLWLFASAIEEGLLWLAAVGVVNSVISVAYYWKVIRAMYFTRPPTEEQLPVSPALTVALGVSMVGVFFVGIFPGPLMALLQAAAQIFFAG